MIFENFVQIKQNKNGIFYAFDTIKTKIALAYFQNSRYNVNTA